METAIPLWGEPESNPRNQDTRLYWDFLFTIKVILNILFHCWLNITLANWHIIQLTWLFLLFGHYFCIFLIFHKNTWQYNMCTLCTMLLERACANFDAISTHTFHVTRSWFLYFFLSVHTVPFCASVRTLLQKKCMG